MLVTCAKARAISVFARPGKSSIRTWPSARIPSRTSSSASRLPTTARSTSSRMAFARPATCVEVHSDSSRSTTRRRLSGGIPGACAVRRRGAVVAGELPQLRAEHVLARRRAASPRGGEPDADDLAHDRPQAGVGVEGASRSPSSARARAGPARPGAGPRAGRGRAPRRAPSAPRAERPRAPRPPRAARASAPTTRMKMSSSSSNQPGASSRANSSAAASSTVRKSQAPSSRLMPPPARRARRARRAGRRARRSRPPSSSRRSRGG